MWPQVWRKGDRVSYKGEPATVKKVHFHSVPEYFYDVEKSDGSVVETSEGKLLPLAE